MSASLAALRVGWCPGALTPMMSGDGLIVRVKPRGAALPLGRAVAVAAAAARHGNGLLDLTARANLQIRGVSDASLPALTAELDALGLIDDDAGAEARRNVLASPLMGIDPSAAFDIRPAVAALEARLAADASLAGLPSKFGVAVSDGGAMPLDDASADLRFDALPDGRFALRLDGDGAAVASCAPDDMPEVTVRLASAFVAAVADGPDLHRMRDLVAAVGVAAVLARAGLDGRPGGARRAASQPPRCVGLLDLPGVGVLGVAAPFGRLDAAQLDVLARGAVRAGATEVRFTPWRSLLVPRIAPAAAARLAEDCAAAGLVVDPADPRLRVAACAGAPGCRRGTTPVLDDAARWAKLVGPGAGIALHVSGCAKGCAHPGPASLTMVASQGRYALVADGRAADAPVASGLDAAEARRLLKTTLRWDRQP